MFRHPRRPTLFPYTPLFRPRRIDDVDDRRAAEMIHADEIDVLIDLVGHVGNNRLLVFAYKPAPVQATYIAHCNTTGLSAIDRKSTRLNSSHSQISYAVFCLK